jgi:hypothetical protein
MFFVVLQEIIGKAECGKRFSYVVAEFVRADTTHDRTVIP